MDSDDFLPPLLRESCGLTTTTRSHYPHAYSMQTVDLKRPFLLPPRNAIVCMWVPSVVGVPIPGCGCITFLASAMCVSIVHGMAPFAVTSMVHSISHRQFGGLCDLQLGWIRPHHSMGGEKLDDAWHSQPCACGLALNDSAVHDRRSPCPRAHYSILSYWEIEQLLVQWTGVVVPLSSDNAAKAYSEQTLAATFPRDLLHLSGEDSKHQQPACRQALPLQ